ncbi:MAG: CHAD domain-containing protein [Steroidobacteraceae bacterium]
MKGGFPSSDAPMRMVRRILLAQIDRAIAGLQRPNLTDHTIHVVRLDLKRARATLRLLRECIGEEAYRRENLCMRDAARPLTAVRDANVLLDTLRRLDPAALARQRQDFVRQLLRVLRQERRAVRQRLRRKDVTAAAAALIAVKSRLQGVPEAQLDRGSLGTGVKRAYESGRKAFAQARKRPTDESLHEWRKQTKYLANQLEILLPLCPKRLAESCKRSSRLAERLGEDHDLALLGGKISHYARGPYAASRDDAAAELIGQLARQRKALQSKAYRLGRQLYRAKLRRVAANLDAGLRSAKSRQP